jgi:hypothetical protein
MSAYDTAFHAQYGRYPGDLPAPKPEPEPTGSELLSRLAYEMYCNSEDARISAERLLRLTEQSNARAAVDDRGLMASMEACSKALSEAHANLTAGKKEAA